MNLAALGSFRAQSVNGDIDIVALQGDDGRSRSSEWVIAGFGHWQLVVAMLGQEMLVASDRIL